MSGQYILTIPKERLDLRREGNEVVVEAADHYAVEMLLHGLINLAEHMQREEERQGR